MSRNPSRANRPAAAPTKRLNQRDMDSSCYRLSRVPQKFAMTKAAKKETTQSFAVSYYASNPIDTRPPQEKLDEVDSRLGEKIEDDDRFALLVQKKSLAQMIYGENSPEAVRASTELGAFYNEHGKPDSALRNLSKGQAAAKTVEMPEQDAFNLAVELADACLNASAPSKQDKGRQVATADSTLSPYAETEGENKMNCFRRDLYLARIRSYRNKWQESLAFYEKALGAYQSVHEKKEEEEGEEKEKEKDPEEANLHVEAGQVAEKAEENEKAIELYKKAKDLYQNLGFEEDARRLEEKIGSQEAQGHEEDDQEPKEQTQEDEEVDQDQEPQAEEKLDAMKIENEEAPEAQ